MSKIFSFRLSKNNFREARLMKVIEDRVSKGYSLRQIFIEAITAYEDKNVEQERQLMILENIEKMLRELRGKRITAKNEDSVEDVFSQNFVDSLVKSAKPGIRMK